MRRGLGRRAVRMNMRILGRGVPPLLIKSNQLLASGHYLEAAEGFEDLADAAMARGGRRAPQLYLQAGRARLLAGQGAAAMPLLDRGLRLFAAGGAMLRLERAGRRIVGELKATGMDQEAETIKAMLAEFGAQTAERLKEDAAAPSRPSLPTHCPSCGAPVHPAEVEWLSDDTAECEYCSAPIRGG